MSICRPEERLGEAAGRGVRVSGQSGVRPQKLDSHRQHLRLRQQVGSLLLSSVSSRGQSYHQSHLKASSLQEFNVLKIRHFRKLLFFPEAPVMTFWLTKENWKD